MEAVRPLGINKGTSAFNPLNSGFSRRRRVCVHIQRRGAGRLLNRDASNDQKIKCWLEHSDEGGSYRRMPSPGLSTSKNVSVSGPCCPELRVQSR